MTFPISYIEPVFRPPSEARSLILPVTNGCSWNNCSYCEMYTAPQKKFDIRPQQQIDSELEKVSRLLQTPRRIFLADGDATTLSTRRLIDILQAIRKHLPEVERVSSYCLPRNLKNKSVEELSELADLGLKILYVGCESGDDKVLACINKGETYSSSVDALLKIKKAGIKSSVMILNGMGGTSLSEQHAVESARLANDAQPDYLSSLVVSFPGGEKRVSESFRKQGEQFHALQQQSLFEEIRLFIEHLNLEKTIFRSDHASNYLVLKGILGRDKQALLAQVNEAINRPQTAVLRQEWQRGL